MAMSEQASVRQAALSERTNKLIESIDAKLNKRCGYQSNSVREHVNNLMTFSRVEVGWREACGHTDFTAHVWDGWKRALKSLRKDGFVLTEERQKHGNKSPTLAIGFWNSVVYTLGEPAHQQAAQAGE